eukprot:TRINITY_DN26629_c0_g1_i1.p1 TRINITY_DN26629_c0_g1~~TRINITY_DN26629_c0_g1_i1.p1  ORF type:complete len:174 (-),score=6.04 TRINITY_DN26629_c0_g1_i1:115-636(-)
MRANMSLILCLLALTVQFSSATVDCGAHSIDNVSACDTEACTWVDRGGYKGCYPKCSNLVCSQSTFDLSGGQCFVSDGARRCTAAKPGDQGTPVPCAQIELPAAFTEEEMNRNGYTQETATNIRVFACTVSELNCEFNSATERCQARESGGACLLSSSVLGMLAALLFLLSVF